MLFLQCKNCILYNCSSFYGDFSTQQEKRVPKLSSFSSGNGFFKKCVPMTPWRKKKRLQKNSTNTLLKENTFPSLVLQIHIQRSCLDQDPMRTTRLIGHKWWICTRSRCTTSAVVGENFPTGMSLGKFFPLENGWFSQRKKLLDSTWGYHDVSCRSVYFKAL